jgi:Arc/MetJ-type ribon-helix-helix transcriptional regulator
MTSKVAHVRLPEAEYRFIDESIKDGYFTSRSDFVKSAIRLQIHETSKRKLNDLMRKEKQKKSYNDILKSAKASRRAVYKEIWD